MACAVFPFIFLRLANLDASQILAVLCKMYLSTMTLGFLQIDVVSGESESCSRSKSYTAHMAWQSGSLMAAFARDEVHV
jgi:uncharacterized membrane protein YeiB